MITYRPRLIFPLLIVSVVFLFGFLIFSSQASKLMAQEPVPPPTVECNDTASPEYHSLRPYQASPTCVEPSNLAVYCGNDLVLQDTVKGYYNPTSLRCKQIEPNKALCSFSVNRQRSFAIDISGLELPIAGNTEDVINSQNQTETLSDANKINDYISWYLNGATNRAEYPPLKLNSDDINKIINSSGPLNKLLPWEVQINERIRTLEHATGKDLNKDDTTEEKNRHDQVVGCVNLLGRITDCYPQRTGVREIRLSDWAKHIPPLPEDYSTYGRYWTAYLRWRGDSCLVIPFIEFSICYNNPFKPDYFANMFKYIPYSSTEDVEGSLEVKSGYVQTASEDMTVSEVSVISSPAPLYFAHMEENKELASLLQSTYVSKDNLGNNSVDHRLVDVQGSDHCSLAQVRTNPGDNLFPGEISIDLSYKIDFSCEFNIGGVRQPVDSPACKSVGNICYPDDWQHCTGYGYGQLDCPDGYICANFCEQPDYNMSCEKTANIYLSTETQTPDANNIWKKLVAGASSVFKRFFPKMGEDNSPIKAVLDIPAASKVTYTTSDGTPVYAENPSQRLGESPELYFPHLGGVEEYFLHAIQTALRPKGYGYNIASGNPSTGLPGTEMCEAPETPPGAGGAPKCEIGVGYCSPENLRKFFPDDRSSRQASIICNAESGGDPSSMNCGCLTGDSVDYSIGLFQINLLAHCCADAFDFTWNPPSCTMKDKSAIDACAEKYFNADENINYAVNLYQQVGWQPWSTYTLTNAQGGCKEQVDAVP